jgi:phage antirepressor YoqD-like protein
MSEKTGIELFADEMSKAMTVQQVAVALGYEPDTIRKKAKELFPESVQMGKTTFLTETQVFELKKNLVPRTLASKSGVESAETALDIAEMTLKVIAYHKAEADRLRGELAAAAPKIESFEALQRSGRTMSITAAAKYFGLHPKAQVFPYLRAHGYLTHKDLPTQVALDAGYLAYREISVRGEFFPTACVLCCQLETWRTRVVPQIAAWLAKE